MSLGPVSLSLYTLTTEIDQEAPLKLLLSFELKWLTQDVEYNAEYESQCDHLKQDTCTWMMEDALEFLESLKSAKPEEYGSMELFLEHQPLDDDSRLAQLRLECFGKDGSQLVNQQVEVEFAKVQTPLDSETLYEFVLQTDMIPRLLEQTISLGEYMEVSYEPMDRTVHLLIPKEGLEVVISHSKFIEETSSEISKDSPILLQPTIELCKGDSESFVCPLSQTLSKPILLSEGSCLKLLEFFELEGNPVSLRVSTTGQIAFEKNLSDLEIGVSTDIEVLETQTESANPSSFGGTLKIQLLEETPRQA